MKLTLKEILEATNATVLKSENVDVNDMFSFSTDTRTIKKGEIYLPLKGANFDGEKFIDKAVEIGAIGYFCGKGKSEKEKVKSGESCDNTFHLSPFTLHSSLILQVEDTLTAYLQLARFYKRKINPKTVAITGSSGKTTTKEMAFCVASEKFKTHKSELNFNNEIGLCKTILAMPEDTQVLILEMGMRGLGEIELLSKYSEPDITIIANVGTAHIGRLGSRENIAKAKCEIVKYQKDGGILIAHDDNLIKQIIATDSPSPQPFPLENRYSIDSLGRVPRGEGASHIASHPSLLTLHSTYFSLNDTKIIERKVGYSKFIYKDNEYELNIEGDYNVQNSLAVIEMGLALGMSADEIKSGLKKYLPIEKRWELEEIKGFKVINDSYNANPESMKAAMETFLELYVPPLLLVIGDMGELGEREVEYHRQIGAFLSEKLKNINNVKVITVGKLAGEIASVLHDKGILAQSFDTNLQTSCYILDNIEIGTTIILKASRSMKFEAILSELKGDKK